MNSQTDHTPHWGTIALTVPCRLLGAVLNIYWCHNDDTNFDDFSKKGKNRRSSSLFILNTSICYEEKWDFSAGKRSAKEPHTFTCIRFWECHPCSVKSRGKFWFVCLSSVQNEHLLVATPLKEPRTSSQTWHHLRFDVLYCLFSKNI